MLVQSETFHHISAVYQQLLSKKLLHWKQPHPMDDTVIRSSLTMRIHLEIGYGYASPQVLNDSGFIPMEAYVSERD